MRLGVLIVYVALTVGAVAQVPAKDIRNTRIISGRMHLQMPVYHTLAEWEARAVQAAPAEPAVFRRC